MESGALQNQCRIFFLLHFLSCCFARKIDSSDPIATMILFKCVRMCVCVRLLSRVPICHPLLLRTPCPRNGLQLAIDLGIGIIGIKAGESSSEEHVRARS